MTGATPSEGSRRTGEGAAAQTGVRSARKPDGWTAPVGTWGPDVLGEGFEARTLALDPIVVAGPAASEHTLRNEGTRDPGSRRYVPQFATLVRHTAALEALHEAGRRPRFVVLYLHGWNDYFFHWDTAAKLAEIGGVLYGLDLRGYGRSLREGDLHNYVDDLGRYTEEIDAAWRIITEDAGTAPRVLAGHSTGGLVASLWAADHPGELAGLALNSPWLESVPLPGLARLTASALALLTRGEPTRAIRLPEDPRYADSLAGKALEPGAVGAAERPGAGAPASEGARGGGSDATDDGAMAPHASDRNEPEDPFTVGWDVEETWRLPSAPVHVGWVAAILRAQARVARGLHIDCPVLVLTSARSTLGLGSSLRSAMGEVRRLRSREAPLESDIVLDVPSMRRRALDLGPRVSLVAVEGAIHDVMASARPARRAAQGALARWITGVLAG